MSESMDLSEQDSVPRDVRLLHLLLASQNVNSYHDHVPLQLMDFAHRYTMGVLKDAMIYNDHANEPTNKDPQSVGNPALSQPNASTLSVDDIRLAIAARTQYQFKPTAPKELLLQLAQERNKKALPPVVNSWGLRLPPEKYCLTAKNWTLENEIDEDGKKVGQ